MPAGATGTRLPPRVLLVVAGGGNTLRSVVRQIEEYLVGSGVRVAGVAAEEGLSRSVEAEAAAAVGGAWGAADEGGSASRSAEGVLILVTSAILREQLLAAGLLDPGTPVIVAERTIDPEQLDRVVALEPGTKALFVNDEESTARECVDALCELGIVGPEYRPWWPGLPPPGEDCPRVAITPGEAALVPPGPEELIDLGPRVLDFATLAQLLSRLGLLERGAGTFSRRYLRKIVQVATRLAGAVAEERSLKEHLRGVLDSLDQGILVYDAEGRISVCTDNLGSMLALAARKPAGLHLGAAIRNQALLEFLEGGRGDETAGFRLADRDIVARRFESGESRVAIFRDAGEGGAASRLGLESRRRGHVAKYLMEDIIGESPAIQRARRIAARLAATDLSILIHGESGTGKELFASAIHAASARRGGPFLAVDLGSLSDDLIESELFGYDEGAFTGARKGGKQGLFELADGGTIFLDEIGHVSAKVQNRLLRVLQEKEVLRVGGSTIRRIDVRVIAATNEDLLHRARRGEFREDLYFRLKTGILRIPPLRERMADIPRLLDAFLRAEGQPGVPVDPALLHAFADYGWPGNVRELRNLVSYMLAVREGTSIALCDLPDEGFFEGLARPGQACPDVWPPSSGMAAAASASAAERGDARLPARLGDRLAEPLLSPADAFILRAIASLEDEGQVPGRESIALKARAAGLDLSPAMVRTRLAHLAVAGLVDSRRGKRGTRLSEAGRRTAG